MDVIAIFDVGKTNKKVFLFDTDYQIVWEKSVNLVETVDEEGFPCENIAMLSKWVKDSLKELLNLPMFSIKAVNFSAYGASFVHLDKNGTPVTPLYNYLKPYPHTLLQGFYETYGGEESFATETASPVLGSLNSGMQLYRIKHEKWSVFENIKNSLHLPQYLSYLISRQLFTEHTSLGCHTNLWNFNTAHYHHWTEREKLLQKFPPIKPADQAISLASGLKIGIGLHDSSSAIIPYLLTFKQPFVLLSTGTWSITLNPFNHSPLTFAELQHDCLCYLSYTAKPVKAARLFAGHEHDIQCQRLAAHFLVAKDYYKTVAFDQSIFEKLKDNNRDKVDITPALLQKSLFDSRELAAFGSYEEAYHQLILDMVTVQVFSTNFVKQNVKTLFVDGGFSHNEIFMNILAQAYPEMEVFAAHMAQASALGAAVVLHQHWNSKPLSDALIAIKKYLPK